MKTISHSVRRTLLWILGFAGIYLFLYWEARDLEIWFNMSGIRLISYPNTQCRHNLSRISYAARNYVSGLKANAATVTELPQQSECWAKLKNDDAEVAKADCSLIHMQLPRPYWPKNLPFPAKSQPPYVINPHLFARPFHLWKDSEIVAVDSSPRHFATTIFPGIRCAWIVKWDGSLKQAYLDAEQVPTLLGQIANFADGAEGYDRDESWSRYYQEPKLDYGWLTLLALLHILTVLAIAILWCVVYRMKVGHVRQRP